MHTDRFHPMTAIGVVWIAAAAYGIAGCGTMASPALYTRDAGYNFNGKTIGLCVILDRDEQEALSDQRVVNRATSSGQTEGYASEMTDLPIEEDTGLITAPKSVRSLQTRLRHWQYYDADFTIAMADDTKAALERRGYRVRIVPVPDGNVEVADLARRAQGDSCDILAVVTVSAVRSWNVRRPYDMRSAREASSSMRWQSYNGGLLLANISMFDLATGAIVWQHVRRVVPVSLITPVIAELYDQNVVTTRFNARPGLYQGWLYRQAMPRALTLLFQTAEPGFIPLPYGSPTIQTSDPSERYTAGQPVFVRPDTANLVWFPAVVTSDDGEQVNIDWTDGIWPAYARRVAFPRSDVRPRGDMPEIVWVRLREKLEFTPYRFVRTDSRGMVHVILAGDALPSTFLPGRVGVVME